MAGLFDLPDVQRVEVLRGPQGTLYGRNSDAGAVRLISQDPTDTLHVISDIGVGDYGAVQTHDLISGPVVPGRVEGSLAFVHSERDGTTKDPTIHMDVNNINYNAARAKLKITPTDDLELVFSADGMIDHSNTAYYTPVVQPGKFNPNYTYSPLYPVNDLQSGGVAMHVKYQLTPELALKDIVSARAWDQAPVIYDNSGTSKQLSANFIDYHQHDYTEELQLAGDYGRFNFVSGFFFYKEAFGVDRLTVSLDQPKDPYPQPYRYRQLCGLCARQLQDPSQPDSNGRPAVYARFQDFQRRQLHHHRQSGRGQSVQPLWRRENPVQRRLGPFLGRVHAEIRARLPGDAVTPDLCELCGRLQERRLRQPLRQRNHRPHAVRARDGGYL